MSIMCPVKRLLVLLVGLLLVTCVNHDDQLTDINLIIEADTLVNVRDTLVVNVRADMAMRNDIRYCFLRIPSFIADTSERKEYKAVWQFSDTGSQKVIVWALLNEQTVSIIDTITIHVRAHKPFVSCYGDTVAGIKRIMTYKALVSDSDGTIDHLEWTHDKQPTVIIQPDSTYNVQWSVLDTGYHTITVVAVDNDGLRSLPDSIKVNVKSSLPKIFSITGDTSISVNDTLKLSIMGEDVDGYISSYQVIEGNQIESVKSLLFSRVWHLPDTGLHLLQVRAIDNVGLTSDPDTVYVEVTALSPTVTLECGSDIAAGYSLSILSTASDLDGRVIRYEWQISSLKRVDQFSTRESHVNYTWSKGDTGVQTIQLRVIDDDSLSSKTAICTVFVADDRPVLRDYPDVILSNMDTLTIVRQLADTNRSVSQYYWLIEGAGIFDSTVQPVYKVNYSGMSRQSIIVTAVDAQQKQYRDTINITFNRQPIINSLSITDHDTLWVGEKSIPGFLKLDYKITDPDNDSMNYSIVWGRANHSDTLSFTNSVNLPVDSTGLYNWIFTAMDSFGNKVEKSGAVHIGIEHTICFAGHSIITGLGLIGGERIDSGGFRPQLLSLLRQSLRPYERIRPTGPLSPGIMYWNPSDDSCFAISGSFAREMLLLMDKAYSSLTADIWVMMLGVNGSFNGIETQASIELVKRMFTRNPDARVYVLTSPPFNAAGYGRISYNRTLRDTVSALNSRGFAAFIVESGDSILSSNGSFNDTLAYDEVHPNLEGYRRLADGINMVMRERNPRVIPFRKEE